jgi:hypothetical protein
VLEQLLVPPTESYAGTGHCGVRATRVQDIVGSGLRGYKTVWGQGYEGTRQCGVRATWGQDSVR